MGFGIPWLCVCQHSSKLHHLSHGLESQFPHFTDGDSDIATQALGTVTRVQWANGRTAPNSFPLFSELRLGEDWASTP